MQETGKTKGWFAVGIGLIVAGGAIYGLLILLGIGFAINQASAEAGAFLRQIPLTRSTNPMKAAAAEAI